MDDDGKKMRMRAVCERQRTMQALQGKQIYKQSEQDEYTLSSSSCCWFSRYGGVLFVDSYPMA